MGEWEAGGELAGGYMGERESTMIGGQAAVLVQFILPHACLGLTDIL